MNQIALSGTIGRVDPVKYTAGGNKKVFSFSLAVNHGKEKDGSWKPSSWFRVTCFEWLADRLEVAKAGDRIMITGSIQVREFKKKDESKGLSVEITANDGYLVPKAYSVDQVPSQASFEDTSAFQPISERLEDPPF